MDSSPRLNAIALMLPLVLDFAGNVQNHLELEGCNTSNETIVSLVSRPTSRQSPIDPIDWTDSIEGCARGDSTCYSSRSNYSMSSTNRSGTALVCNPSHSEGPVNKNIIFFFLRPIDTIIQQPEKSVLLGLGKNLSFNCTTKRLCDIKVHPTCARDRSMLAKPLVDK